MRQNKSVLGKYDLFNILCIIAYFHRNYFLEYLSKTVCNDKIANLTEISLVERCFVKKKK